MKILRELCIILLINFVGEILHKLLHIPIPGNVIGMIILLILLCTNVIKVESIEKVSDFFLKNLAIFFIPAGVGLISCLSILKGNWISIMLICFIVTIIVMVTTGITVQLLKKVNVNKK